ncbi:Sulfite reduction-associated complex DsrMKJOP protein DsrP (= HmeB) [hydrothermal vent metagenome]|uniref:Sulfite reduction-associated complex DsrMKJOP protein DsrP (= HmeB) n=1 Tax=hydrothermal vent metagenome TaxID=652676 RepID=A0A3B1B803_9ZZZZ
MKPVTFREITGNSKGYYILLALLGLTVAAGLGSAWYMEHNGHWVTGMNNQIVWGMPHVFAVFLIVAASGALNVASMSSVFSKTAYKPLAPLSGLMAITLLTGGLMVLVLDLGRPDRLIVAMTTYNFKSIFAWNMILYNGFFLIVGIYLWTMMQRNLNKYSKTAGFFAFLWRLALTTGTGSIFGFIVARQFYDAAIMAPMFIVMSFAFGLAFFLIFLLATYQWTGREIGSYLINRLQKLLGLFVASVLLFVVIFHLTNLYATQHHGVEDFILAGDNIYSGLFWVGYILLGTIFPLIICYAPAFRASIGWTAAAAILVIAGGLSQMYIIIIGGQAFPMDLFPGKEVSSSFFDGVIVTYSPTAPEIMLGLGGVALAFATTLFAVKILRFLPLSLADAKIDPHHSAQG